MCVCVCVRAHLKLPQQGDISRIRLNVVRELLRLQHKLEDATCERERVRECVCEREKERVCVRE